MLRAMRFTANFRVVPQAIFWRNIRYFSALVAESSDDLDTFFATSFCYGNHQFDLRTYRGHPQSTVTLYLPIETAVTDIGRVTKDVISNLMLPKNAVAWVRGNPFEFGHLERRPDDRLREPEARVLALKIAALSPDGRATTEYIKQQVARFYEFSAKDLEPSQTRPRERRWQQIVGNVISHRNTPDGPFAAGYATRTPDGLAITSLGLEFLKNIGFLPTDYRVNASPSLFPRR